MKTNWTGSLAFYARLCQLRMDAHAQKESGDVVFMIGDIVSGLFPVCWEALMTGDVKENLIGNKPPSTAGE